MAERHQDRAPGHLVYVDDSLPGITRRRLAKGWAYFDPHGQRVRDRAEIDRLNAVGLPPAYVDAWFCPAANGHILATGIDARGRKQYRYNPAFRAAREAEKFDSTAAFGRLLPLVRARVEADLAGGTLSRERAINKRLETSNRPIRKHAWLAFRALRGQPRRRRRPARAQPER